MLKKIQSYGWKKILLILLAVWIIYKFLLPAILAPFNSLLALIGYQVTDGKIKKILAGDTSGGAGGTVNPANRPQVCLDVANKIQFAIWDWRKPFIWWVHNITENEAEVVKQLNRLHSASEAVLVSQNYRNITRALEHESSLKTDCINLIFPDINTAEIKPVVYNNIQ